MTQYFLLSMVMIFGISCSHTPKTNYAGKSKASGRNISERKLDNGLQVLYVHDDKLPEFGMHLALKAGSKDDPAGKAGLTFVTAKLLEKGTRRMSADSLQDHLAEIGADFHVGVVEDVTLISIEGLGPSRAKIQDVYFESLFQPAFTESELTRMKQNLIAQAINRVDEPSEFAGAAWPAFLMQGSSYALPATGTPKNLRAIQRKDVLKQYLKFFHPNNAVLTVVGQFTVEDEKKIESALAQWKSAEVVNSAFVEPQTIEGTQVRFINKPNAVQAQLRMGFPSVQRKNPDYLAATVANTILGDAFYSRLMHRIRTELGLTYGIGSDINTRFNASTLEIRTSTKNAGLKQTVDESILQMQKMVSEGVTEKEVEDAKGYMLGQFPRTIERSADFAKRLMILRVMGLPDSELFDYEAKLKKIKVADVNEAIKKYFDPKNIKIFVYGDAKSGMAQLKNYKPELVSVNKAFDIK